MFMVELEFRSDDGQFDERVSTPIRALTLGLARLEPAVFLREREGVDSIQGTFSWEPSRYSGGTVSLYIDLHAEGGEHTTSGWVGALLKGSPAPGEMDDLAMWGVCLLNEVDSAVFPCLDAGAASPSP
jgi:hypothetical protein